MSAVNTLGLKSQRIVISQDISLNFSIHSVLLFASVLTKFIHICIYFSLYVEQVLKIRDHSAGVNLRSDLVVGKMSVIEKSSGSKKEETKVYVNKRKQEKHKVTFFKNLQFAFMTTLIYFCFLYDNNSSIKDSKNGKNCNQPRRGSKISGNQFLLHYQNVNKKRYSLSFV